MADLLDKFGKIHFTQMVSAPPDNPAYKEINTFRRELPRLLAEGHEGRWALVKGDEIVALFDTLDEGHRAGLARYLGQQFLVQPVREWQPLVRTHR